MNELENQEQFRKTHVVPYDPLWAAFYDAEHKMLQSLLKSTILHSIHHIGSTAVPGMAAKPVIDIMVIVTDIGMLEQYKAGLALQGYHWMGEYGIPGRRYLWKRENKGVSFHLQCFQCDQAMVKNNLIFRNYLRLHPDKALDYSNAKEQASSRHPDDMHAYSDEKKSIVEALMQEALKWYEGGSKSSV